MKEKTRKILIMAVMAALIISLMAASLCYAFTYGRYTGGRLDDNSTYDDLIDFVGATAFTVTSPEEFVNAIENGYSYIKIGDGAEDPFVINEDIADVYTNLVLDVNGTTVIRNSRNPVLDVRRSISVVLVYDSSEGATGGFYNPVGSALQTSGGSLTIGSGSYESGPNVEGTETLSSTTATVYKRNGSRPDAEDYAFDATVTEMPSLGGDVYYTGDTTQYTYIENDTYLIYTEEENAFVSDGQLYVNAKSTSTTGEGGSQTTTVTGTQLTPICNVASCDFYYYYPVGTAGTATSPQTYAVVYGYNDVKGLAEDSTDDTTAVDLREKGLAWPYAAIRSVKDGTVGGVTHARGGTFTTNFGTDNTYGIYSVGGTMTVGTDSASSSPKFTATGEGTCIGMSASNGDTLTIASGNFSSQVGDTILMSGGEMTVTGGTFTKTGSHPVPTGNPTATDYAASRTALIHMLGGDLTVNGTVTGESDSRTYSVNMTAGSTDAPLTNVFGIYSTETTDETTGKAVEGTVTISGCKITVNGTYSAGVLSSAGTVNVGGTENGKADTDITVANSIESDQLTSSAVSSEGGIINLNNTVNISSDSLGITARGEVNVMSGTTKVNTENATGVYVNNGTLTVKNNATLEVESKIYNANYSWVTPPGTSEPTNAPNIYNGVYVQNGSLDSSGGTLNVDFTGVESDAISPYSGDNMGLTGQNAYREFKVKSYAVRVESANTTEDDGTQTDSVTIVAGTITNDVGGGVLVNGGTVVLGQGTTGPTVSAKGDGYYSQYLIPEGKGGEWAYSPPTTGGDAVKIVGGSLTVDGGKYTAAYGNGILVSNGTATVNGGTFTGGDEREYKNQDGTTGFYTGAGSNFGFKLLGGNLTVYAGEFSSNAGGAFAMEGTVEFISGTIIANGASGVSAWQGAVVYFGGTSEKATTGANVNVHAASTGIAIETNTTIAPQITIYSGTYTGGISTDYNITPGTGDNDGIWYGNGNAMLTIYDGTFQGGNRSGLYFAADPGSENVKISAGTFYGRDNEIYNDWGAHNRATHNAISGNSEIQFSNILTAGRNAYGDPEYNDEGVDVLSNTSDKLTKYFFPNYVDLFYSRIEIR